MLFDVCAMRRFNLFQHHFHEAPVKIIAAQVSVAVGREHLKDAALELENRDIKCPPA